MKIRTITAGIEIDPARIEKQIETIGSKLQQIKKEFNKNGYDVQTIRLSTQPWETYVDNKKELISLVKKMQMLTTKYHIDYFNIGPTSRPTHIPYLYEVIKSSTTGFCTSKITDKNCINHESISASAALIKKLSCLEENGFANLRYAALCNISAHTPFYPASYHKGPASFGIGLENSDLVNNAFHHVKTRQDASEQLTLILSKEYQDIENHAVTLSNQLDINYDGIDTSICSSVHPKDSIAFAIEEQIQDHFGAAGTLSIAKLITNVVQHLPMKKTGYNGLMLPILEDYGLAKRNNEKRFNLSNLLLYSSVCGTGLDTIPLPGSISLRQLEAILCDVASLSTKLMKPLSARLLPIPGKKANDHTNFDFEYFVNTSIMNP